MKVHNVSTPDFLDRAGRYYYDFGEISQFEIDSLKKRLPDIEELWYQYAEGDYEGHGHALIRKGDLYHLHNASHCSCYGPLEYLERPEWQTKTQLLEHLSDEYKNEAFDVLQAAGLFV